MSRRCYHLSGEDDSVLAFAIADVGEVGYRTYYRCQRDREWLLSHGQDILMAEKDPSSLPRNFAVQKLHQRKDGGGDSTLGDCAITVF